jgi:hypothetical protein
MHGSCNMARGFTSFDLRYSGSASTSTKAR